MFETIWTIGMFILLWLVSLSFAVSNKIKTSGKIFVCVILILTIIFGFYWEKKAIEKGHKDDNNYISSDAVETAEYYENGQLKYADYVFEDGTKIRVVSE